MTIKMDAVDLQKNLFKIIRRVRDDGLVVKIMWNGKHVADLIPIKKKSEYCCTCPAAAG